MRDSALDTDDTEFRLPKLQITTKRTKKRPPYDYNFPVDPKWEISRPIPEETLGAGQYGCVIAGMHKGVKVAVKQLKKDSNSEQDVLSFYLELEVMKIVGIHPNIIPLVGCCTRGGPLWIVVDYAEHGSLQDFLPKHRHQQMPTNAYVKIQPTLSVSDLVQFGSQVAHGMEYLASIKYVHRDLAARNVLVFENHVVKISDFGLTRDISRKNYYRSTANGVVPAAWMASESLENDVYNTQTDVWSFGVLLWEVMSLGAQPPILEHLEQGQRLKAPLLCPKNVYKLMEQCWRYEPEERPTFSELVKQLRNLNFEDAPMESDSDSGSDGNESDSTGENESSDNTDIS